METDTKHSATNTQMAEGTIRQRILKVVQGQRGEMNNEFVAEGTIRQRILKVGVFASTYESRLCGRGDDPAEDTESREALQRILQTWKVAEGTIRQRILKESELNNATISLKTGGRGDDPAEDTESMNITEELTRAAESGRGHDPAEDTERMRGKKKEQTTLEWQRGRSGRGY